MTGGCLLLQRIVGHSLGTLKNNAEALRTQRCARFSMLDLGEGSEFEGFRRIRSSRGRTLYCADHGAQTGASVLADGNFGERCVVNFRVYADRNYWTTAGWEDYVVPDPHESKRGWEGGVARNTCWRGESAGASIARVGQAIQP